MAADEQKIFEQTILDTISQISADRDEIAAGLNAKGLNIQVGSTLSSIAFAASDTSDDNAIKASPTQFGQVKIISSNDENTSSYPYLTTIDNKISNLAINDPYIIPARKNYAILSGINDNIQTLIEAKLNKNHDSAQNLTVVQGELKGVNIKTAGTNDSRVSSTFEGIINNSTLSNSTFEGTIKNSTLSNVSFDLLTDIDIVSSNVVNSQISTTNLIDTSITKISEPKHLTPEDKALFAGYYGTLQNLGYTSAECSIEDRKFYPVKLSICKRNDTSSFAANDVPIYVRILKRNDSNTDWELLYQSYNAISISAYNQLCGATSCLMGPLVLSGSAGIDLTSNIAITFISSFSTPINESTLSVPIASTRGNGTYRGGFSANIANGIPNLLGYSPIIAIQGKQTANYTEDLLDLVQQDISLVEKLESDIIIDVNRLETSATTLSANLSAIPDKVNEIEETLSTKSSIKICEGLHSQLSSTDTLNIRKVSPEEYAQLLTTQTSPIPSNDIYIISADHLVGFGNKIVDVADGTESTDAATFGQLSALSVQVNELKGIVETLSIQLAQLTPTP